MSDHTEEIDLLRTHVKRLERENKALRQTLLDDFAKAALIGYGAMERMTLIGDAKFIWDCAEAMLKERERING